MLKPLFGLLLLSWLSASGQDFTAIDTYAKSVKYTKDLAKLTNRLTSPYTDDLSKVRAIFVCLATNIQYDHKKKAKMQSSGMQSTRIKGKSKEDIQAQRLAQIEQFIEETLEDKKGICQDFAFLFQAMCIHAEIECEFIPGIAKNNPSLIGNKNIGAKHAWNAVKINDVWMLMDVTWSTGMGDQEDYGNGFFNLKPQTMIMTHFPNDSTWQLLDTLVSKQEFADLPYLHPASIKYAVSDILPFSGKVKSKHSFGCKAEIPENARLAIYKNKVFQNVVGVLKEDRFVFDMAKKPMAGTIDVCIQLASGRVQPLYSLRIVSE